MLLNQNCIFATSSIFTKAIFYTKYTNKIQSMKINSITPCNVNQLCNKWKIKSENKQKSYSNSITW